MVPFEILKFLRNIVKLLSSDVEKFKFLSNHKGNQVRNPEETEFAGFFVDKFRFDAAIRIKAFVDDILYFKCLSGKVLERCELRQIF